MKKKKNTDGNGVNKQRTHIHTEHSEKKIERVSIKITDTCLFKNNYLCFSFFIGLTPCKAEQTLQGVELQEKEAQKN